MKRLVIICEGPTEQEFIRDVMFSYFSPKGIFIQTPLIKKSGGGIVPWKALKEQIIGHLREGGSIVTTLIDYYGIPDRYNYPGWEESKTIVDRVERMIFLEEYMLNEIPDDIYQIETFDTTTIRASTPMYMLSKYIKENTDVTVIFSGEGSDEASGSYLYFHNAPDDVAFEDETKRLMKDLCYYDVLRCDKSTAGAGLEVRVPFLDKDFLDYYLRIPGCHKRPTKQRMEKYLLRETFTGLDLLPDSVLWRMKEGMSDGVSSQKRGWFQIIQDHVETKYNKSQLESTINEYSHEPPRFKEALYYRRLFNMFYPGKDYTVPYYWLPKWSGDLVEPSARALDNVYQFED